MEHLEKKYFEYQQANLLRELKTYNNSNDIIDFTTSDYLNLSNSQNLEKAFTQGFRKYGFGSKGSAIVCGYNDSIREFEQVFSNFVGYPQAIFFNSGFMANLAIYSTLFSKQDTLFADKNIHASIIDGIKLSEAKLKRYKHQSIEHLETIYDHKSFVITEGVFSTTGSVTDLNKISKFIDNNKLIVDEAHSFGVIGNQGSGSINHHNLSHKECPIAVFPLGKAFGGVGAVVCTTDKIANYLIQFARHYIYTTALPALILEASITQLENLKNANIQREDLKNNIYFFNSLCQEKNLKLVSDDVSPIRSILIGDSSLAIKLKDDLDKNNIAVSCFRYPTVPKNQSLLRFSIHANNTFEEIQKALTILSKGIYQ
ncbi:pyridoxal phosphate-dependent aminotransferase family protein [Allofrancisella guangzhouensis]|uniref:8-amino-7-oxononanoate synthase n=1 Tax=Allofrancisella guangzhouensis TaxID=594679 RepID=A0A0A8E4T2_9GAMM|nr:pyridoxal phosphate-dependent aminotransferase family protein [Allofrancisella guangzhouensis]AJC48974.1 8-amino-7-oxononanoate synthase [Allofrancisella guangzhouensis]MBK2027879.1 pyridoxal phosphate-dependent aminotransferase family protein [Allofrancisella guangzhouensis]MBK2044132.1 pyridoxal phosphate-dependent aminotransferase family protein [Allofrancisella guangzhouensis]MBK2045112.1 pyridoxal phosphate-dependent aminotransferase family protein [Allofrancisella guangzhouensis]